MKRVYCGPEGTFLLNVTGRVLAFGNNDENQLGLDTLHRLKKRTTHVSLNAPMLLMVASYSYHLYCRYLHI